MACISILLLLDCVSVFILIEDSSLLEHTKCRGGHEPSIVCIFKDRLKRSELAEDEKLSLHMHGGRVAEVKPTFFALPLSSLYTFSIIEAVEASSGLYSCIVPSFLLS
jgi:hypothetical protein